MPTTRAAASRRKFLANATAVAVCSAISRPVFSRNVLCVSCFDLQSAQSVTQGHSPYVERYPDGEISALNLGGFTHYTHEALDFLATHLTAGRIPVIDIGFRALSVNAARALSTLDADLFLLPALIQLDATAAAALWFNMNEPPIVDIQLQLPLDIDAAEELLLTQQEMGLNLSLPSLSVDVANVVSRHTGSSYLNIRDEQLPVEAANILAHHAGYSSWIDLDIEPTPEVLAALSSNPVMPMQRIGRPERTGHLLYVSRPSL